MSGSGSFLVVIAVTACACKQSPARATAPTAAGTVVHVDERVELLAILFRLAGAREYRQGIVTPYLVAVDRHFGPVADHPAVAATVALRKERGISFNAPIELALYLDATTLRPIRPLSPLPGRMDPRWDSVGIDAYLESVADFADVSHARDFFYGQRAYFASVEKRLGAALAGRDVGLWLTSFFASSPPPASVIVPGLTTGFMNYGVATVDARDVTISYYQVISLENPDASGVPRVTDATVTMLVHEMSHPFINPVVDRHVRDLEATASPMFALVKDALTRSHYPGWQLMVKESWVRAATVVYARERLDGRAVWNTLTRDEGDGFLWTDDLADELATRKADCPRCSLDEEIPLVSGFFEKLEARYRQSGIERPRFRGPIDAAWTEENKARAAIVSPASGALADLVTRLRQKVLPAAVLVSGDAAATEISGRPAVLIGSPRGSPLMAEILRRVGWQVEATRIVVGDRVFEGEHLVLVACAPHPDDAANPVVVYAAHDDMDLRGIFGGLFHGPTDWLIARRTAKGFEFVADGFFVKTEQGWQ